MKRVVITGLGITSCLGNDRASVTESLRAMRPGIRAIPEYKELGFRSQVGGPVDIDLDARIDRKQRRFQGDAAAFAHIAMEDAIADAGLTAEGIVNPRIGL
ncbi:MAG: beta-ketoacyl synthase N-terminal-like domain-containing protein, partial [Arenimonas sp.]